MANMVTIPAPGPNDVVTASVMTTIRQHTSDGKMYCIPEEFSTLDELKEYVKSKGYYGGTDLLTVIDGPMTSIEVAEVKRTVLAVLKTKDE